ncbi:hypothetical protein [Acaryochloris sp. IP29b_bin.148]|uniref:hypothetical protein n=1 Tax=Acaryochloris sp. IP29b_bin.148 TaxID=2969218 RepID=UPI002629BC5B|nr:hypothetical protein [Acaryochloris sp. IP29b_bin.148]
MQFDLRPFQPTDRPKLREIYLQARTLAFTWDSTGRYQLEDFDQATQGEVIWVAALGNRPVGYISWFLSDNIKSV